MPNPPKLRKYAEDDFDLEEFSNAQANKTKKKMLGIKNKRVLSALTALIFIATVVAMFFIFNLAQSLIDIWMTDAGRTWFA